MMTAREAATTQPLEVRNASDGTLLATLAEHSQEEVQAAVQRARAAQPGWAAWSVAQRAEALRKLGRLMRDDEQLMATLVKESGKPRYEAELFELLYTLELTRFYTQRSSQRALADELRDLSLLPHKRARIVYHARGVVGVIGPWNWPLLNNFADAIAPLLAGNAVLLKPSEWTPLTSLRVRELWLKAGLPGDIFQVLVGRVAVGRTLVDQCDMIFFTGSERAGKQVATRCAERLVPCVLELGGKSAMIVMDDADLERAARAAVWSGFAHSGQVCIRTERVFVDHKVADEFERLCKHELAKLRHGPADASFDCDVGAMTFPPQLAHLEAQVADAVAQGATLVGEGRRLARAGNFFPPTLILNAQHSMKVMHEETFGPVLPIMRVANVEEALGLTNASHLGLSGSVWSRDEAKARTVARRVESGSVCINEVLLNYMAVEAPLGGVKSSGLGVRHGIEGLRQFCRVESIIEERPLIGKVSGTVARFLSFPYDARLLSALRLAMKQRY